MTSCAATNLLTFTTSFHDTFILTRRIDPNMMKRPHTYTYAYSIHAHEQFTLINNPHSRTINTQEQSTLKKNLHSRRIHTQEESILEGVGRSTTLLRAYTVQVCDTTGIHTSISSHFDEFMATITNTLHHQQSSTSLHTSTSSCFHAHTSAYTPSHLLDLICARLHLDAFMLTC